MNKSELINALAAKTQLSKKDAEKALNAFVDTINGALAFLTIGMVIPVAVVSVLFHVRINKQLEEQEEAEGSLFTVLQENVTGIRVVRAFGRSRFELDKFNKANEENRAMLQKVNNSFAALWATLDLLCGVEFAAVVLAHFGPALPFGGVFRRSCLLPGVGSRVRARASASGGGGAALREELKISLFRRFHGKCLRLICG